MAEGSRRRNLLGVRFWYTGIRVKDLEKSMKFYREALGFKVVFKAKMTAHEGTYVQMKTPTGKQILELNGSVTSAVGVLLCGKEPSLAVQTFKAVRQTYEPRPELLKLLDAFRTMVNDCKRIGLAENATSMKALSKKAYHELARFDAPAYYRLTAISKAAGILYLLLLSNDFDVTLPPDWTLLLFPHGFNVYGRAPFKVLAIASFVGERIILSGKEEVVIVTQRQLIDELVDYEKELKQKLVNVEVDVEEAVESYLAKRDETEDLIEQGRRQDGKYRRKLFDQALEGFREIESGVLQKVRLDLPKLSNQQLLVECSKDLRTVSKEVGGILGGLTRWLAKWGGGSREEKLQARYYQAMTKLLTVLARQNQVVINLLQAQQ